MIKAFIFDLDGTLVNTEMLHYQAWQETLSQNGVPGLSQKRYLEFIGTSSEKIATDLIESEGIKKTAADLIMAKRTIYSKLIPTVTLCKGVRQIIHRYHKEMHLAIASSSPKEEIMAILKIHDIDKYFCRVVGGDMVKHKKPNPEIYLKVQSLLHVYREECVAFEDSVYGLNAANNAGIHGIAIPNDYTKDHDFTRADRVLESLAEVNNDLINGLVADRK